MDTHAETDVARKLRVARETDRKRCVNDSRIQELSNGSDSIATLLMAQMFLFCLATPLLVFPFGWFIFFVILMPFDDLLRRVNGSYVPVFGFDAAIFVNLLHWVLIATVFGYFSRNLKMKFAIPLAYLTITVVVALIQGLAPLLGFEFQGLFGRVAHVISIGR